MRLVRLLVAIALIAAVSGCTVTIGGAAVVPAGTNPTGDVLTTDDGFGIQLGKPVTRAAVEIYIEPQCPHCANFMFQFSDDIAREIRGGSLTVTYRPLTFIDRKPGGYSAQVSNALFLTAQPRAKVPAAQVQQFIHNLYTAINPAGGYAWIAQIARDSQLPSELVDRIGAGDPAVDTAVMYSFNKSRFEETLHSKPYTPAVYDLCIKQEVEITQDWLPNLIGRQGCIAS